MSDKSRAVEQDEKFPASGNTEKPFDQPDGYSGQDYHIDREQASGSRHPSGEVNAKRSDRSTEEEKDLPPENGHRAFFDPKTGEVHGSGAGAGGGNPGEDFDSDPEAGSGYPQTGGE